MGEVQLLMEMSREFPKADEWQESSIWSSIMNNKWDLIRKMYT